MLSCNSGNIQGLLSSAPGALSELRTTSVRLRSTLDTLDPVAQQLRPGARKIDDTVDDVNPLLTAATPLLQDAKPTVRALKPAAQDLLKLTSSGNNLMAAANPVLDDAVYPILPYLRTTGVESKHKTYEMIGPTLSSADAVAGWGDQYGTHANFEGGAGEGSVPAFSPCNTALVDFTDPEKIKCEAATRIIAALVTGSTPGSINVRNAAAPKNEVMKLLTDKSKLAEMTKSLLATKKKETGR